MKTRLIIAVTNNLSSCEIKAIIKSDQLSVGLKAQLVEHCSSIAEVTSGLNFTTA